MSAAKTTGAGKSLPQATSATVSSRAPADEAPPWAKLEPLFGGLTGDLLVISNNPEGPSTEGLLMATEDNPLPKENAARFHRKLSNTTLEAGCPPGSLKAFSFYMHHLNQLGATGRIHVFVEPAGDKRVEYKVWGAGASQLDTGSLDPGKSPSYRVAEALLKGQLAVSGEGGSTFVNGAGHADPGHPTPVLGLLAAPGGSVDARLKVRSTNGVPLKCRVVVSKERAAAEAYALSKRQFAQGNIQCPCCRAPYAWGTPSGVYPHERWEGAICLDIQQPRTVRGFRFDSAPVNRLVEQKPAQAGGKSTYVCVPGNSEPLGSGNNQRGAAVGYYNWNNWNEFRVNGQLIKSNHRDSDPFSTASYGGEYVLTFTMKNSSGACVDARLMFASYPGEKHPRDVKGGPTRFWDGGFSVQEDGATAQYVRVFTKAGVQMFVPLISKKMQPGTQVSWKIRTFVPGLISIPGALIVSTAACEGQG